MNIIGVVGEFNPFHLGHREHIVQASRLAGEDAAVVCVMSGDFVQRGSPAVFDKHTRAEAAALCGADVVFELPLPWCVASAERFAMGAVGLLDSLGVVTHLAFGSEAGDLAPLTALAMAAVEPDNVEKIKARLAGGMSFAAAREMVLHETLGEEARLLQTPNNILAVEYLKALHALRSHMIPLTTHRTEARHDQISAGPVRSASQLRSMMEAGEDIGPYVPAGTHHILRRETAKGRGPVTMEKLETAVMARLRMLSQADFEVLPDATEGLGNRLYKAVQTEGSVGAVLSAVKTKRYPLSRLRRMVLCAVLGVERDMALAPPPYARLLASTARGRALLRQMGETSNIPTINKPAGVRMMEEPARAIFTLTAAARDFYVLGYEAAEERSGGSDWRASPVTL